MAIKIDQKIVKYQIRSDDDKETAPENNVIQMHEKLERPELLLGSTYKIKTPASEHALYITVNDIVLNEGTEHEQRRPFEIFINSKNMEHFQWVLALTRIISAVFRKGGDVTFLVEELHSVFDPRGGYFKKGGKFMPSLVAEIGEVIESHMRTIGMISDDTLDENQRIHIQVKRAELAARDAKHAPKEVPADTDADESYPASATLCTKCHAKAVVVMDGCMTCLSCADSKCG
jgi:hypothetical protein